MFLSALSLLLGERWPAGHVAFGGLVAVTGLALLITGEAVPKLLLRKPRLPAAYRLTGIFLVGWGGFLTFYSFPPYRLFNVVIVGVCAAVAVLIVFVMRRRPELSPFGETSAI